ncbi:hypothetical protein [Candidatus Methylomirabilis sp.]|uniref:Uncharacterized protein n=1 Tax=Candidatus Methylomirabilis tolerans TaxID=3123416 RepID=A0AAJ1AHF1_9BACT|nr:hypothetical protein [Candidatus Methylomirabilis sp.]
MKFLRKMFGGQRKEESAQSTSSDSTEKEVQGVLILTRQPVGDSFKLLEQITTLQRSKGYSISLDCISKAATTEKLDDEAFLHEKIRKEFAKLGGEDLIARTKIFPCQASSGNSGIYCIIFNRP